MIARAECQQAVPTTGISGVEEADGTGQHHNRWNLAALVLAEFCIRSGSCHRKDNADDVDDADSEMV